LFFFGGLWETISIGSALNVFEIEVHAHVGKLVAAVVGITCTNAMRSTYGRFKGKLHPQQFEVKTLSFFQSIACKQLL
jgi:hypothetical protein